MFLIHFIELNDLVIIDDVKASRTIQNEGGPVDVV